MKKTFYIVPFLCLGLLSLVSCTDRKSVPGIVLNTTGYEQWETKVDYSSADNWLKVPEVADKEVDAIYFYPTAYRPAPGELNLSAIDNASMREGARGIYGKQAAVFEESCNVYAPFYRQLDASYALTITDEENAALFGYAASKDASDALDYYFENYNNGRPFILAGHSQGSETALYLLAGYFKAHPDYYSRMVAAYVIGYSVTRDFLADNPHVKFASGPEDTGVVVSWNTEGPANSGKHNAVLLPNAVSINPINWRLDDTPADVSENMGSLEADGRIGEGIADAVIDLERGSVICTTVDPAQYSIPMEAIFGPQCYHGYDYCFYYANIKENVKQRVNAWLR